MRCYAWRDAGSNDERNKLFAKYGVRWTELARLNYFDIVRMTIVDPMHVFLLGTFHYLLVHLLTRVYLGLLKNQWYPQWIKRNTLRASTDARPRELDLIHKFLLEVSLKCSCNRPTSNEFF
jgi:hypothetical protein